ncbi:MAG TPA: MBL fold metallo-hydrolase [Clostridiales bacterium]|nr:MAG: metal-dependent hydrolase [Firmicutes bacterium ADurb.Bin262]HOU10920.1 MBL fold metallo-hydrolase [Clostridiales bacterium]HQH63497.1 MBL fold metallo-hydrolase [Clostridiales bacterium]HQK72460.1 MBL fold metallo-hydrolase [Clostridiales bacterium]
MKRMVKTAIAAIQILALTIVSAGLTGSHAAPATPQPGQIIRIPCGMVNCYLIVGQGQCVLVDTGASNSRKKVYDAVKDYPVSLIVLTHGHYDHIQNAAYLAEKLNAKIAMHADDAELIANQAAQKACGRTPVQKISALFSNLAPSAVKIDPFRPDFFVSGGQTLEQYGIDAKIIELKGHTKGSIGILVNGGADFIVGDAMMNIFKVTEPFLFVNYDDLRASMKIIEDSGATVYPGHGRSYTQS